VFFLIQDDQVVIRVNDHLSCVPIHDEKRPLVNMVGDGLQSHHSRDLQDWAMIAAWEVLPPTSVMKPMTLPMLMELVSAGESSWAR